MKSFIVATSLLGMALAFLPGRVRAEAKPTPVTALGLPVGPQAVFINEPGFGKDPFFPRSNRNPVPKTNDVSEAVPPPPPAVPDEIVVKGINILKDHRFAIINHYTVAPGEDFELKIKGKAYRVRCVEIKDTSVVISVNGLSKELKMRTGI